MARNNLRDSDTDYSEYEDVKNSDEEENDDTFFDLLTEERNKLSIYGNDFNLTKTNRGGLKLCSLGYYYTKERVTKAGTYHWKYEKTISCNGQGRRQLFIIAVAKL
ncbi:unnamed protein product [Brachionus calyciflorus]|uniref:Uncharacterized protein n=1 Tax=Brachionus calyciflorus TaxID=104777 RepID=A0A813SUE8_9BILA|nr:unnamed protein product [Brachionus calyciflorus]